MHTPEGAYPIVDGAVAGSVDHLTVTPEGTRIAGWAAYVAHGAPAEKLALILGDRVMFVTSPHVERPDVVEVLEKPEILECGFDFILPEALLPAARASQGRLFAVSRGTASELHWPGRSAALAAQSDSTKVLR
jgi:hypothetical protein